MKTTRFIFKDASLNELASLSFATWQRWYQYHVPPAWWQSLMDDWRQHGYYLAVLAFKKGLSPGERRVISFFSRGWYSFLREYGLRKASTRKPKASEFSYIRDPLFSELLEEKPTEPPPLDSFR